MLHRVLRLKRDVRGATAIEYGLIAALIACGLIVSLGTVGSNLGSVLSAVADGLAGGTPQTAPTPNTANHVNG